MARYLSALIRNTRGATAIEYGLIAALIAIAAMTAMSSLGNSQSGEFNRISAKLNTRT